MITLLNGEKWDEKELLSKMDDDSFYYGHLGKHALSTTLQSTVKTKRLLLYVQGIYSIPLY